MQLENLAWKTDNYDTISSGVVGFLDDKLDGPMKLFKEPIAENMSYLLDDKIRADDYPVSWKKIDDIIKETYLSRSIPENHGNIQQIEKESGYSYKQIERWVDKYNLKDFVDENRPINRDPFSDIPTDEFQEYKVINSEDVKDAFATSLSKYETLLSEDAKKGFYAIINNNSEELTDCLNKSEVVTDFASKVEAITNQGVDMFFALNKYYEINFKDAMSSIKAQIFHYVFDKHDGDTAKLSKTLGMSKRNVSRLKKEFNPYKHIPIELLVDNLKDKN